MRMKIFIDFDDVLLNTKKFRSDYKNLFSVNGIPNNIFEKYYYDYPVKKRNGKLIKYDSGEHLKQIKNKEKIKTAKLHRDISKLIKEIERYVFSDARKFLETFNKGDLYLISYAKTKFQERKIKNSGLAKYFRKIIIIDKLKAAAIKKILKQKQAAMKEKMYFIDDRAEQINDVKKKIPAIMTILIKRKEGRYSNKKTKYCDYVVKNLIKAKKIIKLID